MTDCLEIDWQMAPSYTTYGISVGKGAYGYAVLNNNLRCALSYSYCKEFILDSYLYSLLGGNNAVPIGSLPMDRVDLLIGCNREWNIANTMDFIHRVEDRIGVERTKVFRVKYSASSTPYPNVYVFRGSRKWITAPPLLSLYGLMYRHVGNFENYNFGAAIESLQMIDCQSVKIAPFIAVLAEHGIEKVFGDNLSYNWNFIGVHGCGIAAFLNRNTSFVKRPHWYRYMPPREEFLASPLPVPNFVAADQRPW